MSTQLSIDARPVKLCMDDADVTLVPGFFSRAEADTFLQELLYNLTWEQPMLRMFGRDVASPRLHAWYGDPNAVYRWSGRSWTPHAWCEPLGTLRERISTATGAQFNSCLANRYRTGDDAMGMHADDEPELGNAPVIASLSFGVTRDFDFRRKDGEGERIRVQLDHGSLLIMEGETQTHWKHGIPRRRKVDNERVNLTFRLIR